MRCTFVATAAVAALCGVAQAEFIPNAIAQVNATEAELLGAGYTRVGATPYVSNLSGDCAENGCVDFVGFAGALPTRGYFQFQFLDYIYNPTYYSGMFAIMNINFSGSTITPSSFISQVNALTSQTGITAKFTNEASDAQSSSFFNEWLPTELDSAIVFNWIPDSPPSSPGLSQVFTFAWDLDNVTAFNNGLTASGIYGVPTPGAIALLGLAGLAGRRRR
jgi:hypothetical protein